MSKIWYNIRCWAIGKLAGDDIRVVMNAPFEPGSRLYFAPGDWLINRCTLHGE